MMVFKNPVGVIGATSLIGHCLLPLLIEKEWEIVAFSRRQQDAQHPLKHLPVKWQILRQEESPADGHIYTPEKEISHWVCLAPIWVLREYFPLLSSYGVKHVVAISSTSRFTKDHSSDPAEQATAQHLADGETGLAAWAKRSDVTWTILRPTLTYGLGRDGNITVIARFIRRFSFFPFLGPAEGLRQPVHVHDVALSCLTALSTEKAFNRSYNISGGETLSYREMVERIFGALGRKPRFVTLPLWPFRMAILFLRLWPPFRHWSVAMAGRMNQDLVFDHTDARRDLGFMPRSFQLTERDLPDDD
jgi:nucleoside-diphosphate-sugar epimerase